MMNGNLSVYHWRAEEEQQKILPSTEENSLKPAREKCGGVWGRRRAVLWWWLVEFRITGHSQHLWAPLLCPANTVPCHQPYGLIVAGRSTGGCAVGKTLALLGGELQATSLTFLSYQMCISKTHVVAAWIDAYKLVPTVR